MAKKKAKPLTHTELAKRLRDRYTAPEWVLLEEVNTAVGWSGTGNRADMIGLSTYPSRGLRLAGFELKSSRADVLKELKEPDKARAWSRYCSLWYLVVGRSDLCGEDELPPNWGLIVPHGTGLRVKSNAVVMEPEDPPRETWAMLVRKAYGNSIGDHERAEIESAAFERGKDQTKWVHGELKKLEARVCAFEKASGIKIAQWSGIPELEEKGRIVRAIMSDGVLRYRQQAMQLGASLTRIGDDLAKALEIKDGCAACRFNVRRGARGKCAECKRELPA